MKLDIVFSRLEELIGILKYIFYVDDLLIKLTVSLWFTAEYDIKITINKLCK